MLTYKRPGTGINPKFLDVVVGRVARVDIPDDTTITWEMV
jgi:sialic acid synthase SpsE